MKKADHLIEFYGTECEHCKRMAPLVEKLEKDLKIEITKLEVWHNQENATILKKHDKDMCGGVPFFINTKTNKFICGAATYEQLKKWAQ